MKIMAGVLVGPGVQTEMVEAPKALPMFVIKVHDEDVASEAGIWRASA